MLKDFNLCIDTKFVFGKDAQNQIGSELKQMGIRKVLIHHDDGKFLYDTGLLDQVKEQLKKEGIETQEFFWQRKNMQIWYWRLAEEA